MRKTTSSGPVSDTGGKGEQRFGKRQIMCSSRLSGGERDVFEAILVETELYTLEEAERLKQAFYHKEVK